MTACYNNILLLLLFHFSGLKALLLQLVNFADTPIRGGVLEDVLGLEDRF